MAKRGRKRKSGPRLANGRLNYDRSLLERITPTAELLAKKIARFRIAGVKPDRNNNVDLRLSESWLGVLRAANVVTQEQYDAGQKLLFLWMRMFPQGYPNSALDDDTRSTSKGGKIVQFQSHGDGEADNDALGEQFKLTQRLLDAWDRKTRDIVVNLCCFDRFQRFIDVDTSRPLAAWQADARDKTRVLTALEGLAELYGITARQNRRAA